MSTTMLPPATTLRSSDFLVNGADIAALGENWEVGYNDYSTECSVVSLMLDGWWGRTLLRSMPIALLRRKLRMAIFGVAPDRRSEKKWQRQVDQLIADAVNTGEVQLMRDGDCQ
jgi:hypothetical protein